VFTATVCRRDVGADGGYSVELICREPKEQPLMRFDIFRDDPHYHLPADEQKQCDFPRGDLNGSLEKNVPSNTK